MPTSPLPLPALITKPENVYFLTNFHGSFGEVIKTKDKTFLITDSRYKLQAQKQCFEHITVLVIEDYQEDLNNLFEKLKITDLFFESTDFSYAKYLNYKKLFSNINLKPLQKEYDLLRIVKTPQEINKIQKSQKLNEQVLTQVQKLLKPGITELEIAKKIITIGYDLGAQKVSFDPIVAFGKNSAAPHYTPSTTQLKETDIVLIDMGFIVDFYCSDMTRTFLPKNPSTKMQKMYNLVLEAQLNCINNTKPGMTGTEADALSRSVFEKAGYENNFTHANGHGVGLEIHEAPSLSPKEKHWDRNIKLEPNMVITVEPGLYFDGEFGIRIEDMIVIQKDINQNLTTFIK